MYSQLRNAYWRARSRVAWFFHAYLAPWALLLLVYDLILHLWRVHGIRPTDFVLGFLVLAWLVLARWYFPAYRDAMLALARGIHTLSGWVHERWFISILVVAAIAGTEYWRQLALGILKRPEDALRGRFLLNVVILSLLAGVLLLVLAARRRVVVEPFVDRSGKDAQGSDVKGAVDLLLNELNRLSRFYSELQSTEQQNTPNMSGQAGDPAPTSFVDTTTAGADPSTVLRGAISTESKLGIWGLQIPIGAMLAALSPLVQGSRISGSIHMSGDSLVLVASLHGRINKQWRVDSTDLASLPEGSAGIAGLVRVLAYQIFVDTVPAGTRKWRAFFHYAEGLRLALQAELGGSRRPQALRRAEDEFRAALFEDDKFGQCFYNLGTVFRNQQKTDSAIACFEKALEFDLCRVKAMVGLASIKSATQRQEALELCEKALRIDSRDARAWELKGILLRQLLPEGQKISSEVLRVRHAAAELAWRQLCRATLAGDGGGNPVAVAASCTFNCAVALAYAGDRGRQWLPGYRTVGRDWWGPSCNSTYAQASRLAPQDGNIRFEMSKELIVRGKWRQARASAESAFDGLPPAKKAACALVVANAHHELSSRPLSVGEQQALRLFADIGLDIAADVAAQCMLSNYQGPKVRSLQKFAAELQPAPSKETPEDFRRRLTDRADKIEKKINPQSACARSWKAGRLRWRAADSLLQELESSTDDRDPSVQLKIREARDLCEKVCLGLSEGNPIGFRQLGAWGSRAMMELRLDNAPEALKAAQKEVESNPVNSWGYSARAIVYQSIQDLEQAEKDFNRALQLNPEDEKALTSLAQFPLMRTSWTSPEQLQSDMRRTIERFQSAPLRDTQYLNDDVRLQVYQALAYCHFNLGNYAEAIRLFEALARSGPDSWATYTDLAKGYLLVGSLDRAEESLSSAMRGGRKSLRRATGNAAADNARRLLTRLSMAMAQITAADVWQRRGIDLARESRRLRYAWNHLMRVDPARLPKDRRQFWRDTMSYYHHSQGRVRLRAGKLKDAEDSFNKALQIEQSTEAYLGLCSVYLERIKSAPRQQGPALAEQARQALENAITQDIPGQYTAELARKRSLLEAAAPAAGPAPAKGGTCSRSVSPGRVSW